MEGPWEDVKCDLQRFEVPGGWIYRALDSRWNEKFERFEWLVVAATFVPRSPENVEDEGSERSIVAQGENSGRPLRDFQIPRGLIEKEFG